MLRPPPLFLVALLLEWFLGGELHSALRLPFQLHASFLSNMTPCPSPWGVRRGIGITDDL